MPIRASLLLSSPPGDGRGAGRGGQVSIPLYGLDKTRYTIFSFLNTVSFQTRSPKRVNLSMSGLQYFRGTSCPSSGDLMKKWKAVTSHRWTKSPFVDSCLTSLQRPPRYKGHFLLSPGVDSHMKQTGMLVVSLRGVNFGFWSRLGCSGQSANILSCQGLV